MSTHSTDESGISPRGATPSRTGHADADSAPASDTVSEPHGSAVDSREECERLAGLCRSLRRRTDLADDQRQAAMRRANQLRDKLDRLQQELLRKESEVRYQIGDAIVRAARPSKDTLLLPWRLIRLFFRGRRQQQQRAEGAVSAAAPLAPPLQGAEAASVPREPRRGGRPSYLFFCVNGGGLGHLTRALAIARRVRRLDPDAPICFLSSSPALAAIYREGFVAYHIPPYSAYGERISQPDWNNLLSATIEGIAATHDVTSFIYDGVVPYGGLHRAMRSSGFAHAAMILRLRHKHDNLVRNAERIALFDQLILPGEAGVDAPRELDVPEAMSDVRREHVAPIVYLDRDELLDRAEARLRLQLSPDARVVYVQLGAGNINDIDCWLKSLVDALAGRPNVEVLLAESPVASRAAAGNPAVRVMREYPASRFARAFDLAITAVGYNTFHEHMHFGVPTILIPNQETLTDDQLARARAAESVGAALVVTDPADLASCIARGLDPAAAVQLARAAENLAPINGANEAAERIHAAARRALQTG